jgi:glyoxylase-like metal-dependent hydrolase (beta-lactamase superfamily II)
LILDAGTGIRSVTALLGEQAFSGTVLLTHLHWDHVQGLPFFSAGDRNDARVRLLLPEQEDGADAVSARVSGFSGAEDVVVIVGVCGAGARGLGT